MAYQLLVVTIPALLGAIGTAVSAYIAVKVRTVEKQTNSRLIRLEKELELERQARWN